MEDIIRQIGPQDILEDQPFTHPAHTPKDKAILEYMLDKVCLYLIPNRNMGTMTEINMDPEPDGRFHRRFIPYPKALSSEKNLAFVGFFGTKKAGADPEHFGNLGQKLLTEIPGYNDILSYSTMELENGDFSNLVILRDETVKTLWRHGKTHFKAVERSPGYYDTVRIYNGELPGGVGAPELLNLVRVKYWDYTQTPTWQGVRSLI